MGNRTLHSYHFPTTEFKDTSTRTEPLFGVDPALGDIDYRTNWGVSKYHSLQVNLVKRYAKGLAASVALDLVAQPSQRPRTV